MTTLPDILFFALLLALPLTLIISSVVLLLYRRSLLRWMGRHPAPSDPEATGSFTADPAWHQALQPPAAASATATDSPAPYPNRQELQRRERRFWGLQALLWLLIGISAAVPYLLVNGLSLTPLRALALGVAWASPGWMALGLIARLPAWRALALILGFVLLPSLILWLSLRDPSTTATSQLVLWLLPLQGFPLLALSLLVGIPALRACAPLLYPGVLLVTLLALAGQAALAALPDEVTKGLLLLVPNHSVVLLLAHLLPALAGLWLVHGVSRRISHAYRLHQVSDLCYTLAISTLVVLLFAVIPSWSASHGAVMALSPLLAWLWLPLTFKLVAPKLLQQPLAPAPTLLVLRLFRRPGPVGWLFDQVVHRWCFLGPVLLISAADLALRTLDADELTDFIDGRLGDRFVASPADLRRQIAPGPERPDHDGRYRVHDLCCYDSSWQGVLEALLRRSQLVLMDLRGFQPSNRGCLHELSRLAATPSLKRVVLLVDQHTDRTTAEAALAGGPPLRWVEERSRRHPTMEAVLKALCQEQVTA
jgi:hypothetical protein